MASRKPVQLLLTLGCLVVVFAVAGCERQHQLESGRPMTAIVHLERSYARQVSGRQYQFNDQVATDPLLADAHAANPAVYYPRTKAALIAGPTPGSDAFWREPLTWGTNEVRGLIPANVAVHFTIELSGGRVAVANLGAAVLPRNGIGDLQVRLTSENRDAVFLGDFISADTAE